jgi:hypothetical protein
MTEENGISKFEEGNDDENDGQSGKNK